MTPRAFGYFFIDNVWRTGWVQQYALRDAWKLLLQAGWA